MKQSRFLLGLIACITIFSAAFNLPKNYRFHFQLAGLKVDRTIHAPDININLGPISYHREVNSRYGLDLSGGTHFVLEADMSKIASSDRDSAFVAATDTVERRVNLYGLSEPIVQQTKVGNANRIIVEIPGISNIDEAIDLIGKTAQLTFYEEASDAANIATPSSVFQIWSHQTELTGKHLKRSEVVFDPKTGTPEVSLEFNEEGAKLFEDITRRNVGKTLAPFLDDELITRPPRIEEVITGGKAVIRGTFTIDEAKRLSIALNSGALPVPLKIIEQQNIGATLGEKAIEKSVIAGLVGLSIIALFMIINYGVKGIVANVALIIYTLVILALFKLIPVTLTLAGIAGFILSVGMAVDANILIFERMKEEMRWGKDMHSALEAGFDRAFPSIRDSNISSLITCMILYWFGSGMIRGFALTLALGIVVSLFSAITVTRTLLRLIYK